MKKYGIVNAQLSGYIAALGKTDTFMICGTAMPIPTGIPTVDLALVQGIPSLEQTLEAILTETEIEFYFVAEELEERKSDLWTFVQKQMPQVDHELTAYINLRQMSRSVRFAVRTGDVSPFGTVILRAGLKMPEGM